MASELIEYTVSSSSLFSATPSVPPCSHGRRSPTGWVSARSGCRLAARFSYPYRRGPRYRFPASEFCPSAEQQHGEGSATLERGNV
jgi:hypothetical protein